MKKIWLSTLFFFIGIGLMGCAACNPKEKAKEEPPPPPAVVKPAPPPVAPPAPAPAPKKDRG